MIEKRTSPAVGSPAPEFNLPARSGRSVSLASFRGKQNVLVYFYPKDDTPGCTREACSLRDGWKALQALDVEVLGISRDSVASHEAFAAKHALPFELLSDADHAVHEAYGAWGVSAWGVGPLRKSFLVGKDGRIRHVFDKVDTEHHAEEVLKAMQSTNPPGGSQPPAPEPKPAPAAPVSEAVEKAAQAVQTTMSDAAKDARKAVESAAKAVAEKADTAKKAVETAAKVVAKKADTAKKAVKKAVRKAVKRATAKAAPKKKKSAPKKAARKSAPKKKAARKAARKPAKKAPKRKKR